MSNSWTPRNFDLVKRGYAPSQVDETFSALVRDLTTLRNQRDAAQRGYAELEQSVAELRAAVDAKPTYLGIGDRIERILTLAEEEANELRTTTADELARNRDLAGEEIDRLRTEADAYAAERRSTADAEVQAALDAARSDAANLREEADRYAEVRRQEGDELVEQSRARAAQAIEDFELTLARRREEADREFAAQTQAIEERARANERRAEEIEAEAAETRAANERAAAELLAETQARADDIVRVAEERAAAVRAQAERELADLARRRDNINQQLTNVRQMLSTLTGLAPSQHQDSVPEDGSTDEGSADSAYSSESLDPPGDVMSDATSGDLPDASGGEPPIAPNDVPQDSAGTVAEAVDAPAETAEPAEDEEPARTG